MGKLNALQKPDFETSADDWVSALFDGELDAAESKQSLGRIGKEMDAARLWSEYSLIGDALRGCHGGQHDFDARIRAALAEEPTILAPMPMAPDVQRPYYWMAAAVAVAAIAWGVISESPQPSGIQSIPVAANSSELAGVSPASNDDVQPYLAAHQDYAFAVVDEPEMHYTRVSLAGDAR